MGVRHVGLDTAPYPVKDIRLLIVSNI